MELLKKVFFLSMLITTQTVNFSPDDIDDIIVDFHLQLFKENFEFPKEDPEIRKNPMSLVKKSQTMTDSRRTFEHIAQVTSLNELSEDEKSDLIDVIEGSHLFKKLVNKCQDLNDIQTCDPDCPYRTFDGTCNNLENPGWGSVLSCYNRLLPSQYEDLNGFRKAVSGGPLPEPRFLSVNILKNISRPDWTLSHMFTFFGQMLAYDLTDAPPSKVKGQVPLCCPDLPTNHPECFPITLDEADPFIFQLGRNCISFVRSAPCTQCNFEPRNQANMVTSFIDLHSIYGRTEYEAKELMADDGSGKLAVQESDFGELMSMNKSEDDLFCPVNYTTQCFKGGDSRINQNTMLMALNTLFVREHNRLVNALTEINPHWDGDTLYQEARRINIAVFQNIVYKSYIPLLLGPDLVEQFDLWIRASHQYNDTIDPTILSEFSSFAFRLHSLVNTQVGSHGCADVKLRNTFANVDSIHQGCTDTLLEASCQVPSQKFDRYLVDDITDFINRKEDIPAGFDLASFNIQRGRDFGIPPYVDYVGFWSDGFLNISTFDDLNQLMSKSNVDILKKYYEDVNDVDAWIGMQMEDHIPGSPLGGTAAYITAMQFHRLKHGDRFFFENELQPKPFTTDQLLSISIASLSKLICDNTDVGRMPIDAFVEPSPWNFMPCDQIPGLDLNFWMDPDNAE